VEGPQSLWAATFNVSFEPTKKPSVVEVEVTYQKALVDEMRIPAELQNLITDVLFQEPPGFF
ncbi:MAG: hypothetical protein KAV87_04080, partial [Desulfobacteraceae bacterium]|nr:hypothetical protein [Desulfobacteraceae bacterium]